MNHLSLQPQKFQQLAWIVWAVGFPAAAASSAETTPPPPLPRVEVEGQTATDTQLRRDFVAGKIVISRRSIAASGLGTVQQLLEREPSVTVGAHGRLGLLGLPGYTQVLVNGKPPDVGRSPLDTELMRVERVEIVKGSLAQFGPFGVAGTINIVTREPDRSVSTSLSLGATLGPALAEAQLNASQTQRTAGSAWTMQHMVSVRRAQEDGRQSVLSATGQGGALQPTDNAELQRSERRLSLTLSSTLGYRLSQRTRLTASPSVMVWRTPQSIQDTHQPAPGALAVPDSTTALDQRLSTWSLPLGWRHRTAQGHQVEVDLSSTRMWLQRQSTRQWVPQGVQTQDTSSRHAVDVLSAELTPAVGEDHELKLGLKLGHNSRHNRQEARVNDQPDPAWALFGSHTTLRGHFGSAFVQDEWRITERWAATAGMSTAWRQARHDEGAWASRSAYRVRSPSLHVAYKLDALGSQRVRLSLARSFRAPELDQWRLRPTLHALAPCSPSGCGTNSADRADTAGNPALRAEQALGVTAGFEHSWGRNSLVSVDLFSRRMRDVIGDVLSLESVPWATQPRWVIRPDNLGQALTQGLNLDARLSLRDVHARTPKAELRAGATLARSRLSTVPGPDNRLPEQSPWSAKLGGSYKLDTQPLELSLDAQWAPGMWVRTADTRRFYQGRRSNVRAQAAWTLGRDMTLNVAVDRLGATPAQRIDTYGPSAAPSTWVRSLTDTAPRLTLSVDMKV
ncbi:TonB-dependent receptor plug domain-containing protein [Roseateles sp. BYS180W]|uniref:TonB-dependent receptor plug domain-containing protein n=1 Tax=Roseateles rivi TaxID=3299028 RepID=A0ABW7FTH2_9BURK